MGMCAVVGEALRQNGRGGAVARPYIAVARLALTPAQGVMVEHGDDRQIRWPYMIGSANLGVNQGNGVNIIPVDLVHLGQVHLQVGNQGSVFCAADHAAVDDARGDVESGAQHGL